VCLSFAMTGANGMGTLAFGCTIQMSKRNTFTKMFYLLLATIRVCLRNHDLKKVIKIIIMKSRGPNLACSGVDLIC